MSFVPTSSNDDANPYDQAESDLSSKVFLQDRGAQSSNNPSGVLGPVKNAKGHLLRSLDTRRQIAITDHYNEVSRQIQEIQENEARSTVLSGKHDKSREELEATKVKENLEKLINAQEDEVLGQFASKIVDTVNKHPGLLSRMKAMGVDVDTPEHKALVAAHQAICGLENLAAVRDQEITDLRYENQVLRQQLQAMSDEPRSRPEDLTMRALVGVDFGTSPPVDAINNALAMAKDLEHRSIASGASRWMQSLRMTIPTETGRSAREQALWLWSNVHKRDSDFSLADIHAFALAMQNAPASARHQPLAFFHSFVGELAEMLKSSGQLSVNQALILLRSMELLLLHLSTSDTGYRLKMMSVYQDIAPLLLTARVDTVVRGLESYVMVLATGNTEVQFATLINTTFSLEKKQLTSSGADLVLVEGDEVHVVRGDRYRIELDALEGLRFVVVDFPRISDEWRSPWLGFDKLAGLTTEFSSAVQRIGCSDELEDLDTRMKSFHMDATG